MPSVLKPGSQEDWHLESSAPGMRAAVREPTAPLPLVVRSVQTLLHTFAASAHTHTHTRALKRDANQTKNQG